MPVKRKRANGKTVYNPRFKDSAGVWREENADITNKRVAKERENAIKASVADGTYVPGLGTDALSLSVYAKQWIAGRTNKTRDKDEQRLRDHVLPVLGDKRMRELKAATCIQFVQGLVKRKMNPKTIQNVWGVFRTLLRDAEIAELISFHPVMPAGIIPSRKPKITEVYDDKGVLWLCTADDISMSLFATIAFYSGMRCGEICGLRWSDWARSEGGQLGSLTVSKQYDGLGDNDDTKTGRVRIVPVHPYLARVLDACWELVAATSRPIVPTDGNEHHTRHTIYKAWQRHCKACGVKSLGIHRTRHTAITAMRRGGSPAVEVERVTHNSAGTIVDRYTHDWSILCAVVASIDYQSRVASRVALDESMEKRTAQGGVVPLLESTNSVQNGAVLVNTDDSSSQNLPRIIDIEPARGTSLENLHSSVPPSRMCPTCGGREILSPSGLHSHKSLENLPVGGWTRTLNHALRAATDGAAYYRQLIEDSKSHPDTPNCHDPECLLCGVRDCPHQEPMHYHHDGCPACCEDEPFDLPDRVNSPLGKLVVT